MKKNFILLLILLSVISINYVSGPREAKAVLRTLKVTSVDNYYPAYSGTNSSSNPAYGNITIFGEMDYSYWYGLTGNTLGCANTPQRDGSDILIDNSLTCGLAALSGNGIPWWSSGSTIFNIDYASQIVRWQFSLDLSGISVGQHRFRLYADSYNWTNNKTVTLVSSWVDFYVTNPPPPPVPATINITSDRAMSWGIDGSPPLCGSFPCYSDRGGQTRSYSFDAANSPSHTVSAYAASANVVGTSFSPIKKLASKLFNFVTASSGSGATCYSTPGGNCNINLTTTYCSVYINGLWNGGANTADNFSFQINGPGGTYTINSTGYYNLIADPGWSTYNVISSPSTTATQRGYSSDLVRSPDSFTCSPSGGGDMEFEYKSRPILDVR